MSIINLKNSIICFTILLCLLYSNSIYANNISVSKVVISSKNVSAGLNNVANFSIIQFDISWENSWRVSYDRKNWDAAWLFIKYRAEGGAWQHAYLNNTGHTAPTGSTIQTGLLSPSSAFNITANPGMGAFIYRSANGKGLFSKTGVQLRWNYGANAVTDAAQVEIQVYAIEMVYVPLGSYYLGTEGTETSAFYLSNSFSQTPTFPVTSEAQITVSGSINNLYYPSSTYSGDQTGSLVAAFPKGYSAYYSMKYEISQQGYVDFLNSLTRVQQNARTATSLVVGTTSITNRYVMANTSTLSYRNGIRCNATIHTSDPLTFYCDYDGDGIGGESTDGQNIACNYLNCSDLLAYLDWSGLRPMTELEYEKSCKGNNFPLKNIYAWGNTLTVPPTTLLNPGTSNETSSTNNANANVNGVIAGPMRVGAFASAATTPESAGASYYGIMELSGNVTEQTITIGNASGRAFTGIHGNGVLDVSGNANVTLWPVAGLGAGLRGGSWQLISGSNRCSDRQSAALTSDVRDQYKGGRGVRLAP